MLFSDGQHSRPITDTAISSEINYIHTMKAIKFLIWALILALVLAPWGVGMLVEKQYKKLAAHISEQYASEFKFDLQYNRGYLGSTVKTEITNLKTGGSITLLDSIYHGPIIFKFNGWTSASTYMPSGLALAMVDTRISGPTQDIINALYQNNPAYSINTTISFVGNGKTTIKMFPLHAKNAVGEFNWDGAEYVVNFDKTFTNFAGTLTVPNLMYREGEVILKATQLDGKYNAQAESSDFKLNISQVALLENDQSMYEIQNFMMQGTGIVKNKLLNGDLEYQIQSFNTANDQYGPIDLKINMQNVDPALANELANATEVSAESDQKLLQLLSNQPLLSVNLQASMPAGNINMATQLVIGGASLTDVSSESILKTLRINTDLKVPSAIVNMLLEKYVANEISMKESLYFMEHPENLSTPNPYLMSETELQAFAAAWTVNFSKYLIDNNYIIISNGDYLSNIVYVDEVISVNGDARTAEQITALRTAMIVEVAPAAPPAPAPVTTPADGSEATSTPDTATPDTSDTTVPTEDTEVGDVGTDTDAEQTPTPVEPTVTPQPAI